MSRAQIIPQPGLTAAEVEAAIAAAAPVRYYAEKGANETRTSSTLTDDGDLQVPVTAGVYRLDGVINCETTAGAYMAVAVVCAGANGVITSFNSQSHATKNLSEGNNIKDNASGMQGPMSLCGTITVSADSTVVVQWATIQSSTTTMRAGSYIELFPTT